MSDSIRRSYPGGPSRADDGSRARSAARPPTVAEIEERVARHVRLAERSRRRRRIWIGFVSAFVAAGAIGFGVGRAMESPEPAVGLPESGRRGLDREISEEVNRTLLELWKMEDVEYARGRRN